MATSEFRDELIKNANAIARPGYGILAADESTGTIGKKFDAIKLENTEINRQRYRNLLFTTPGLESHISGVILYDETARQNSSTGVNFCKFLTDRNILPGIKLDKGVKQLMGTDGETATQGLDDLDVRCKEYYAMGCRFAKWRAVLKIDESKHLPSNLAVAENVWVLARYASICQQNGLVPIVEPEILSDGTHDIAVSQAVNERVWAAQIKALNDQNVLLEGCLIKPNMVTHGQSHPERDACLPQVIAARTLQFLLRTIPPAMVGVCFLSGGQSELQATLILNAINQAAQRPWALTFSYGRALQNTCIKTWNGSDDNLKAAQDALIVRAKANSEATKGAFVCDENQAGADEKLVIENYVY